MMNIQENISLQPYNTFGIDKKARFFVQATSEEEVIAALNEAQKLSVKVLVLGGGSNILLTKDQDALVIKIEIKGIRVVKESEQHVWLEVGAGENWHAFVDYCITKELAGVENLSLIPGTVGASPMQNIGAYGIEIKEVFDSLRAIDRKKLTVSTFLWEDCQFGYRESVFKNDLKDQYIITHVTFKLSKAPVFHVEYGAIKDTLTQMGVQELSIGAISRAVVQIRQSKLPDPKIIGNAGSFFKNPTILQEAYDKLKSDFPSIPGFPNDQGVKIPAAWLIEQTGWKGKKFGPIGVHEFQPLVLVNYGGGDGEKIKALSEEIQASVAKKFGIHLHPEVNFL